MRRGRGISAIACALILCCLSVLGLTGCGGDSGPTPGSLSITTTSLPDGRVNQPYSASLTSSGGAPPYTWSVSPALPANLSLDPATGAITGTPTTQATTTHTFTLRDNSVPAQTVQQGLNLTVLPPPATLTITTTSLPDGTVNQAYNRPVQATGGTAPLTWSISAGALPAGLNINSSTGAISGTPTAVGTSSFTVRVQDTRGQSDTQALSITINSAPPPPTP
ncbi:MAG TPA: Ig domain-containing protein, partial [Nitrospira sp.]|nr:Ig domain-containing protein [Nitrospira sp.]